MIAKPPTASVGLGQQLTHVFHSFEDLLAIFALGVMVALPLAEIVIRPFIPGGIPGSIPFVEHLTLWVGFLGAALAARHGKLIALATASFIPDGSIRRATELFSATVAAIVSAVLARAAVGYCGDRDGYRG